MQGVIPWRIHADMTSHQALGKLRSSSTQWRAVRRSVPQQDPRSHQGPIKPLSVQLGALRLNNTFSSELVRRGWEHLTQDLKQIAAEPLATVHLGAALRALNLDRSQAVLIGGPGARKSTGYTRPDQNQPPAKPIGDTLNVVRLTQRPSLDQAMQSYSAAFERVAESLGEQFSALGFSLLGTRPQTYGRAAISLHVAVSLAEELPEALQHEAAKLIEDLISSAGIDAYVQACLELEGPQVAAALGRLTRLYSRQIARHESRQDLRLRQHVWRIICRQLTPAERDQLSTELWGCCDLPIARQRTGGAYQDPVLGVTPTLSATAVTKHAKATRRPRSASRTEQWSGQWPQPKKREVNEQ